ncbi:ABC transporter substrate-binding protein [Neobacillus niacini]|uniref:ABC transporter substrate-binding protein n=1 Tax=Neobacillus niacini TaxID=86668 RepID=UPI0021CB60C4|nr:ABC transporter substrate-binding protein [Neobacillus niacini]MCM3766131.1 ABC transporter substrate-binding protein [Neobacillus niacini]
MRRKSAVSLSSIILSMTLLFTGCSSANNDKAKEASSKPKEIVIGNIGAMTGSSAVLGRAQSQGVDLAVKEINENGGILGAKVKVVNRDDGADPTKSKTFMEELVDKEKVEYVVGPTNSTPAAASMAYLQQNKIISILPIATSTQLISPNNPYAFRLLPSNEIQAKAIVKIAVEEKFKRIALVADTSALGTDGMSVMEEAMKSHGVTPAAKVTYKADDSDMTPVAQKIKDAKADVALFWTLGADGAKIVRALERVDYIKDLEIIGYTGLNMPNFNELAGPGAEKVNTVTPGSWALDPGKTELTGKYWDMYQKVVSEYGEKAKRDTSASMIASGYDAVYLLKWAIEKAGTTDSDKVKAVLETDIKDFDSVYVKSYAFSKDSHEGFPVDELFKVKIGEMAYDEIYKKAD